MSMFQERAVQGDGDWRSVPGAVPHQRDPHAVPA